MTSIFYIEITSLFTTVVVLKGNMEYGFILTYYPHSLSVVMRPAIDCDYCFLFTIFGEHSGQQRVGL